MNDAQRFQQRDKCRGTDRAPCQSWQRDPSPCAARIRWFSRRRAISRGLREALPASSSAPLRSYSGAQCGAARRRPSARPDSARIRPQGGGHGDVGGRPAWPLGEQHEEPGRSGSDGDLASSPSACSISAIPARGHPRRREHTCDNPSAPRTRGSRGCRELHPARSANVSAPSGQGGARRWIATWQHVHERKGVPDAAFDRGLPPGQGPVVMSEVEAPRQARVADAAVPPQRGQRTMRLREITAELMARSVLRRSREAAAIGSASGLATSRARSRSSASCAPPRPARHDRSLLPAQVVLTK